VLQKAGLSGEADPENYLGGSSIEAFKVDSWAEHEIYVNGAAARSEFRWDFHATLRKDGSAVTTHGVETQIYRKEEGKWRLVHVHYSEDRQSTPLGPAKELGT